MATAGDASVTSGSAPTEDETCSYELSEELVTNGNRDEAKGDVVSDGEGDAWGKHGGNERGAASPVDDKDGRDDSVLDESERLKSCSDGDVEGASGKQKADLSRVGAQIPAFTTPFATNTLERASAFWYPERSRLRAALEWAAEAMTNACSEVAAAAAADRPWTEEEALLRCTLEQRIYKFGHEHNATLDALLALVEHLNSTGFPEESIDIARTIALRL